MLETGSISTILQMIIFFKSFENFPTSANRLDEKWGPLMVNVLSIGLLVRMPNRHASAERPFRQKQVQKHKTGLF